MNLRSDGVCQSAAGLAEDIESGVKRPIEGSSHGADHHESCAYTGQSYDAPVEDHGEATALFRTGVDQLDRFMRGTSDRFLPFFTRLPTSNCRWRKQFLNI